MNTLHFIQHYHLVQPTIISCIDYYKSPLIGLPDSFLALDHLCSVHKYVKI